jgi:hypothetical protein
VINHPVSFVAHDSVHKSFQSQDRSVFSLRSEGGPDKVKFFIFFLSKDTCLLAVLITGETHLGHHLNELLLVYFSLLIVVKAFQELLVVALEPHS